MVQRVDSKTESRAPEPRWPALIAVLAAAGLSRALRSDLIVGPPWVLPSVLVLLSVPNVIFNRRGRQQLEQWLGFAVAALMTLGMITSLGLLVAGLPSKRQNAAELLASAVALWLTNILLFALWYWRLDGGGPLGRDARARYEQGAFLFPQMTMSPEFSASIGQTDWAPNFVDYLFLAFNTSTAFSPTDAPALTRWAKVLMMIQSLISLSVLALLAGRAVNII
jgi:hypothetical protein